jgi:c-di-GMP-binding flagellar brake protein YcgR
MTVLTKFKLIDISNRGALVKTPQRLQVGSVFKVRFDHTDHEGTTLTLRCKVMRCGFSKTIFGDDGEPIPLYLVGFKFIELNEELVKELKLFIVKEEILMKKKEREADKNNTKYRNIF